MSKKVELFVPGRLCLFGEHSDWAGKYVSQNAEILPGKAVVTGINLGIYATAEVGEDFYISSFDSNKNFIDFRCQMHREILLQKALENLYFSYCCGVAAYMRENYHVGGIKIVITDVTLPMKKGLSSSAAICVLVAKAFNELYHLRMSTRGIMQAAYRGERLTMSRCGRLDQACAYGENPVVMGFSDEEISVDKIKVGKTLNWVFADLCAGKNTKKILTCLNSCYPYAQSDIDINVQQALGEDNHRIIAEVCEAMNEGNAEKIGLLMNEAQRIFDEKVAPACPEELTAPVLHKVLNDKNIKPWVYGGKGVGSQGDGTVQFLAKDKGCQNKLVDYINNQLGMEAFSFDIHAGGKIKNAIIPIAGYGTRMYPETHFVRKAFFPMIDNDNIVKPVLLILLEELFEAEIEEIIIIVGEGETKEYQTYFNNMFTDEFENELPDNVKDYYKKILSYREKLIFVEQKEKKGFGHAVYQAREYLKGEPALLLLGDFVYKSNIDFSCTKQTIKAYNKSGGKNIIAIKAVPVEDASTYGIVSGEFDEKRNYLMNVQDMVEKPSVDYAINNLLIEDQQGKKRCYATFGQYILTDDIFRYLESQIASNEENHLTEEIDLTAALRDRAKDGELVAVKIAGDSFDVGIPQKYYSSFVNYYNYDK